MKYLKLFESHEEFFEIPESEFYKSISTQSRFFGIFPRLNNDFDNFAELEDFSDRELFEIRSLIGDGDYRLGNSEGIANSKKYELIVWPYSGGKTYQQYDNKIRYMIYKLRDEWFVLDIVIDKILNKNPKTTHSYYKCDQLGGLLECIKKSQSF